MRLVSEVEPSLSYGLLQQMVKEDPLLNILDNASLAVLLRYARSLTFRQGDIVVKKKEEQEFLLVVLQGSLGLSINHRPMGVMLRGHWYGLVTAMGLNDPLPYLSHFDLVA